MTRIVMITGASRGIGAATAREAARQGYDVCVNFLRNETAAAAVVAEVRTAGTKAIAVQAGDRVDAGQELCVLEAMKMKNVIRSSRSGGIARLHVSVGQHFKHNDALVEFVA